MHAWRYAEQIKFGESVVLLGPASLASPFAIEKHKHLLIRNCNFAFFIWVWNLVSYIKERTWVGGVWENRMLRKIRCVRHRGWGVTGEQTAHWAPRFAHLARCGVIKCEGWGAWTGSSMWVEKEMRLGFGGEIRGKPLWRLRHSCEDWLIVKLLHWFVCCLRLGTCGRMLWTQSWTFGFP